MGARGAIEIENDTAEIARAIGWLEAFCRENALPSDVEFAMALAFDELLTNTISYGFPDHGRHLISIALTLDGRALSADISDTGIPFDPLAQPAPDLDVPIEERPIGGLGIHFVRTMLDEVAYRRTDGRNQVTVRKLITLSPA